MSLLSQAPHLQSHPQAAFQWQTEQLSLTLLDAPSHRKKVLGARTLLGAPGRTTSNKKLLVGARTLLGAPGIATRSKDATRGSWHRY